METPDATGFTRTRGTWLVLLCALSAWLVTSFWTYRVAASSGVTEALDVPVDQILPSISKHVSTLFSNTSSAREKEQAAEEARLVAEERAAEEARILAEEQAAEEARLRAEEQAVEEARLLAEEQAAEEARLLAEEQAAAEARVLAEVKAAEEARRVAEEQAAEEARVLAEEQAAAEARVLAEEQAAEEARMLAEEQAAEEARQFAEEQAAEEARVLAEEQAAEEARLLAEEQALEQELDVVVMVDSDQLEEVPPQLTGSEKLRTEELRVLAGLSARLRFQGRSEVISRDIERVLDRIFDPLFLYSDTDVVVTVATNEFRGNADNNRLSRDRANAIADYLVGRGLDRDRFRIQPESGIGLPYGSHRIKMAVEELEE